MNNPRPDPSYIEAITQNPDLETMFLLMEAAGIGFTIIKRDNIFYSKPKNRLGVNQN